MSGLKKIKDDKYIIRFFRNLSLQKDVQIKINYNDSFFEAIMFFNSRRGIEPSIRAKNEGVRFVIGDKIEITFSNDEVIFLFTSVITGTLGNTCDVERPSILLSSFRRVHPRVRVPKNGTHKACFIELGKAFDIKDISSSGFSFITENFSFQIGEYFYNVLLQMGDSNEIYVDARIERCSKIRNGKMLYACSMKFRDWKNKYKIFEYQLYNKLKNIKPISTEDCIKYGTILKNSGFYEAINIINEKVISDFSEFFYNFKNIPFLWFGISRLLDGKPGNFSSVLRIYNRTFQMQQIHSSIESKFDNKSSTEVFMGLAEYLMINPGFNYLISYIAYDVEQHKDTFQEIYGIIGNRSRFIYDTLQLFKCSSEEALGSNSAGHAKCEMLNKPQQFLDFCKEKLEGLEIKAYSYTQEHYFHNEIIQLYNVLGKNVSRALWRVVENTSVCAYAVAEYNEADPGIYLTNMCRVYFVETGCNIRDILQALIASVAMFYKKIGCKYFYISFKAWDKVAKDVELPGLKYLSSIGRVMADRNGIVALKKFLSGNIVYITRHYNLSHPQLAIWYTEKFYPNTNFGNITEIVKIKDNIDFNLLERAINLVISKNSGMRIRITEEGGEPKQYFSASRYQKIKFCDFSEIEAESALMEWDEINNSPFELIDTELFHFAMFRLSENIGGFFVKGHHLICDGWSMTQLIINKIVEYYIALKNGVALNSKPKPSYSEYITSEREYLLSSRFKSHKDFWDNRFSDIPELMCFKTSKHSTESLISKRKIHYLSPQLNTLVRELCVQNKFSPFVVFLAGLSLYLCKVSMKKDLVIGAPVLNRSTTREKQIHGMFVSVVPIRLRVDTCLNFKAFLEYVSREWNLVLKNQKYPFDLIQKGFREKNKCNENLYDIVISFQNMQHKKQELEYDTHWKFNGCQTEALAIHVSDRDVHGYYRFEMDYRLDKFEEKEVDLLFEHTTNLLKEAILNAEKSVSQLEILTISEKHKVLVEFNNTNFDYPRNKTIHRLFEDQAEKTPDNIAVVYGNERLTYEELNQKSNQLSSILIEKGIKTEDIVGIMLKPSIEMIIGLMGILKSGASFLPIDISQPTDRASFMLKDSSTEILLTDDEIDLDLNFKGVVLNIKGLNFTNELNINSINTSTSENLAYIIYTSGSSGTPKGVLIEHRQLVNLCFWHINNYSVSSEDRATKYAGFSFDASVWEVFPYLICGASIYIVDESIKLNMMRLNSFFTENGITIGFLPTQICEQFIRFDNRTLRILLTGGDKLNYFVPKQYKLFNNYGPTENTVVSTCFEVNERFDNIPIGKPVHNTKIYILNADMQLQPIGVAGELCISGESLSRGYLNRPELNNDKFVLNPFITGDKIYKTGDLARWLPDGNIEFLGRIDNQVKIRGYRIELGEIESHIANIKGIKNQAVNVYEDKNGEKSICAYYVSHLEVSASEIRKELSKKLPGYMIPVYYVRLKELPLSPNGKLDRKALPEPLNELNLDVEFEEPCNEIESEMVKIWKRIFGANRIGVNDNFFELGGDSIKVIQIAALTQAIGFYIDMQDIYLKPTIRQLVADLKIKNNKISQKEIEGIVKLTPIQMWFFNQKFEKQNHFNQSFILHSCEGFEERYIKEAFIALTKHHDVLRMVFKINENTIQQYCRKNEGNMFDFKTFNLMKSNKYENDIELYANEIQSSIDIEDGPLVKLGLFKTKKGDFLIIAIHHLVIDMVSWRILLEDFKTSYSLLLEGKSIKLPEKTDSFKKWSEEISNYSKSNKLIKEVQYWRNCEEKDTAMFKKQGMLSWCKRKDCIFYDIVQGENFLESVLIKAGKAYNSNVNDILLTALIRAIKQVVNNGKALIALEGHGREKICDIDVSRTLGWFTSLFPVLLDINEAINIANQIKIVKETLRKIPKKGIGYGVLKYLTKSNSISDISFGSEPEICFNYLGQINMHMEHELFTISDLSNGFMISPDSKLKYAIEINAVIYNGLLKLIITFNGNIFNHESAMLFIEHYKSNLSEIIRHCLDKPYCEFTPSDFGDLELTLEEMDEIVNLVNEIEEV